MRSELSELMASDSIPSELIGISNNHKMRETGQDLSYCQCHVVSVDLSAGYTCPAADICKGYAKWNSRTNKTELVKVEGALYTCYAARHENQYPNTFTFRKNNTRLIGQMKSNSVDMAWLIIHSIMENASKNVRIVRIHSSGDFFSKEYYHAWLLVAWYMNDIKFYGYTKVLPLLNKNYRTLWTNNIRIVYSMGGIYDKVSHKYDVPKVYVITNKGQSQGLPIACVASMSDDYVLIMEYKTSFNLLIH